MNTCKEPKMTLCRVIAFGLLACLLYGAGAGLRADIGILLIPLSQHSGVSYEDVSFCIAVMQLVFGLMQPVFGMIAGRRSNRFVLGVGIVMIGLSLAGMILARSFAMLLLSLGLFFGCGAGALAFGLILTSAVYFVGRSYAMIISGMLNAAAGMVGFILSPLLQFFIDRGGVVWALMFLIVPVILLIPASLIVTSRDPKQRDIQAGKEEKELSRASLGKVFHHRIFLLLLGGFSTCGFHMVIIESHLFSQFILYGMEAEAASWAFSVYGIATICGALLSGALCSTLNKGKILAFLYGFRAVWTALYLFLMPKTFLTAVIFAIGLGITGDATVSPTAGLVSENFTLRQVATLMGILFLAHQIGAFFSAWLGGVLLTVTGGYTAIWLIDIVLCLFACIVSGCIGKQKDCA